MEVALPTALAAAALLALLSWRTRRRRAATSPAPPPAAEVIASREIVTLDIGDVPPGNERVQRLVRDAASRVFVRSPAVAEVEVRSRSGTVVARVPAVAPLPRLESTPPMSLLEPHPLHRTGSPVGTGGTGRSAAPGFDARERPVTRRPLADTLDLTPEIRRRIRRSDDPVDVVRAILDAGGLSVRVDGEVITSGDVAIVVLPAHTTYPPDALSHAYVRFLESHASEGIVLSFGYLDPENIRHREVLAPSLRHAGADAIQRMADAVALGADPLAFALGPAVLTPKTD